MLYFSPVNFFGSVFIIGGTVYLVVCLYVVGEVVPGDGLDVLGRAQDGSAQGGALPQYCTVTVLTHE